MLMHPGVGLHWELKSLVGKWMLRSSLSGWCLDWLRQADGLAARGDPLALMGNQTGVITNRLGDTESFRFRDGECTGATRPQQSTTKPMKTSTTTDNSKSFAVHAVTAIAIAMAPLAIASNIAAMNATPAANAATCYSTCYGEQFKTSRYEFKSSII